MVKNVNVRLFDIAVLRKLFTDCFGHDIAVQETQVIVCYCHIDENLKKKEFTPPPKQIVENEASVNKRELLFWVISHYYINNKTFMNSSIIATYILMVAFLKEFVRISVGEMTLLFNPFFNFAPPIHVRGRAFPQRRHCS